MTASLPLGSTRGLQIFVVWPVGASPGIKQLWEIEFPDPPGLSPGNVCTCVHTPTYTRASVEVSKLQTKVFYRGALK